MLFSIFLGNTQRKKYLSPILWTHQFYKSNKKMLIYCGFLCQHFYEAMLKEKYLHHIP